jgi:hypothetical protein
MRIKVRHIWFPQFIITIDDGMTIRQVKQQILNLIRIPVEDQTICYHGFILPDRFRVCHLHLNEMSTIYLSARLPRLRVPPPPPLTLTLLDELSNAPGYERLHHALQSHPRLALAVRDSELMGQCARARTDPARRLEYLRSVDRMMNIVDARRSGSRDLIAHHAAVDEIRQALIECSPRRHRPDPTIVPGKLRWPNTAPLPCRTDTAAQGGRGRGSREQTSMSTEPRLRQTVKT